MKNILLIGTGRFGRHIAVQLFQLGHQVMAVDTNEERINDVLPYVTNAQIGDSTNAIKSFIFLPPLICKKSSKMIFIKDKTLQISSGISKRLI